LKTKTKKTKTKKTKKQMAIKIRQITTGPGSEMTDMLPVDASATTDTFKYTISNVLSTGAGNVNSGTDSRVEGQNSLSSGIASHSEGQGTIASGNNAHSEGVATTASADGSHAEGNSTTASGPTSHAEGDNSISSGNTAHAEGSGCLASGQYCHAEGNTTTAFNNASHAEGNLTVAAGDASHVEGNICQTSGVASHAEGNGTTANGPASHSEGQGTIANSSFSHAGGSGVTTDLYGEWARASSVAVSTQKYGIASFAGITVNSVATELFLNYPTNTETFNIPSNSTWSVRVDGVASNPANGDSSNYRGSGLIKNVAGTVSLINAISITSPDQDGSLATTVLAITADNTNKTLKCTVTGIALTTIEWFAKITFEKSR
jgi:hypothetical protein